MATLIEDDVPNLITDSEPFDPAEAIKTITADALAARIQMAKYRPENDDELHEYIWTMYHYRIPRVAVCHDEDHCAPFDPIADSFFGRTLDMYWVANRFGGKTLGFAILDHLECHFDDDEVANVGAVQNQVDKLYRYIRGFNRMPWFAPYVRSSLLSKTEWKRGGFLEIMPATPARVNSPHPRIACWDEYELTPEDVIKEGSAMAIRQNGKPPVTRYTSSLKKPYGPMVQLMAEAEQRGIKRYVYCLFENIEKCPPTRHQNGEGCKKCPLAEDCLRKTVDEYGNVKTLPGPGRAADADGFVNIDDAIRQKRTTVPEVWDSQFLAKRPLQAGLIYPQWSDATHIVDYRYNPTLPVIQGFDYGFTNPYVVLSFQVLPDESLVLFDEIYTTGKTTEEIADMLEQQPWRGNVQYRVMDPEAAGDRQRLADRGFATIAANNDVMKGFGAMRYALRPPGLGHPLLYVDKRCVNFIREIRVYHNPDQKQERNVDEKPQRVDDHAMDAARYVVMRALGGAIKL